MTSDVWSPEQLSHIESIRQLKARYFRLMDMKLWNQMSEVFALDIECDYRGAGTDPVTGFNAVPDATETVLRGLPAAVAALREGLDAIATVHSGHSPEITFTSAATARATWAMTDLMRFPTGGPYAGLRGFGHYHDTYSLIEGRWKIQTMKLTRLLILLDNP